MGILQLLYSKLGMGSVNSPSSRELVEISLTLVFPHAPYVTKVW